MQLKDYYSILELPASASREDIKKAYRRLALLYHPDKSNNDPYALARFAAVKEAYETLTDPGKKNEYLQQRWYTKSQGIKSYSSLITPELVLKKILELDQYTSRMDIHRINKKMIQDELHAILPDEVLAQLKQFQEPAILRQLYSTTRKVSLLLDAPERMALLHRLDHLPVEQTIRDKALAEEKKLQQRESWEEKKIWLILLAVSAICLIIYFANK